MSGHSKWSQTKRKKSVTDAAKSRAFSQYAHLITLESKKVNGILSAPGLAVAITRAKSINMPRENIERAIAKGVSKDADNLEQIIYEAYGPGGVALLVEALTDNKNRTTQEVKHVLASQQIELASPGSTSWAFIKSSGIYIPREPLIELTDTDEERLRTILEALDAHEDIQQTFTNARGYENISD